MTTAKLQGWYEDPFRLHEARYFSAGQPTKLVRDGDVESYDEPPSAGMLGSAVSGKLNRAETNEVNEANGPNPFGGDLPVYTRRGPRAGVLMAVAAVAVAGIVTAAVIVGKPQPAAVPVTEAMAYTATMNASSADVYASFALTTSDHKFDVTATESGPVSWSADQGDLAMKTTLNGRQIMTVRQITDGRETYTKIAGLPGAAGWTETTWTGTSAQDSSDILAILLFGDLSNPTGIASPASLLGLLRAQASSVHNLGGDVLDGVVTTHYRALIPLSRLGTGTAADLREAERVLGASFIGVHYWIDSNHLLRQLRFAITALQQPSAPASSPGEYTVQLGSFPMTFSISLRLSHYGTPAHVVPPPPAQITSRGTCVVSGDGFSCTS